MSQQPDEDKGFFRMWHAGAADQLPEPREPYMSSPWEFDEETLTLNLYETLPSGVERLDYQVDLERCATREQVLDWIMHISEKFLATDQVLAALVRDLRLYLGPTICFGPGTTDVKATIKKQIPWANAMRGKRPRCRVS